MFDAVSSLTVTDAAFSAQALCSPVRRRGANCEHEICYQQEDPRTCGPDEWYIAQDSVLFTAERSEPWLHSLGGRALRRVGKFC